MEFTVDKNEDVMRGLDPRIRCMPSKQIVMAGLGPAIHESAIARKDLYRRGRASLVDGPTKSGHDGSLK
jgi:hypothetical protein